ncbi:MAG: hypothetical protein K6T65_02605 [Peptococcaceae bacterium]|nr:hypothetical protein [Peptococcaceae bacterium]
MARIEWRNMSLRILSVVLAFLLWIYATNEQNPVNDQILSIPLKQFGKSDQMIITGIPSNVSIRVQGPRTQVTALSAADFEALVDLSGVTEGEQYVQVKVTSPPGIQVTQVTPPRIHIKGDKIVEQQVAVAAVFKGNPARGYTALDPVIQPDKVTAIGPRSQVSAIDQIKITVDIESAAGVVEQTVPVNSGQKDVRLVPQVVKVTVPVTTMPSKTVMIRARTTGEPAGDYEVTGVTINPANVQVVAPSSTLAGINLVETEAIDISGADRDVKVRIGVSPPPGAIEVKPATVEVTVQLKKAKAQPPGTDTPAPPQR